MALKVSYTTEHGVQLESAYITVGNVYLNKSKVQAGDAAPFNQFTLQFAANVYADQHSYKAGKKPVAELPMAFVYDTTKAAVTNAYEHLKKLPEFVEAVDC